MSDHEHGTMDTTEQHKTFAGFMGFATKTAIAVLVFLILLAMING